MTDIESSNKNLSNNSTLAFKHLHLLRASEMSRQTRFSSFNSILTKLTFWKVKMKSFPWPPSQPCNTRFEVNNGDCRCKHQQNLNLNINLKSNFLFFSDSLLLLIHKMVNIFKNLYFRAPQDSSMWLSHNSTQHCCLSDVFFH